MAPNETKDLLGLSQSHQISDSDDLILQPTVYSPPPRDSRLREQASSLEPSQPYQKSDREYLTLQPIAYCPPHKYSELRNTLEQRQVGSLTREDIRREGQRIENEKIMKHKNTTQMGPAKERSLVQDSLDGRSLHDLDGASNSFSHRNAHHKQTTQHNNTKSRTENWLVPTTTNHSMELGRDTGRPSHSSPSIPEPLQIRKQSSQVHIARSQQQLAQNQFSEEYYENPLYPPRPSSARNHLQPFESYKTYASRSEALLATDHSARSSQSSHKGRYRSDTSVEVPSENISTARSTVSSFKENYLSDASPEIMGNFVPINPWDMATKPVAADDSKAVFYSSIKARRFPTVVNPYEFEPSTPINDARQSSARLFDSQDDMFLPSPQPSHVKNSRSEGHALYDSRSPSPPVVFASNSTSYGIHRSESSPTVSPLRFEPHGERSASPGLYYYQHEDDAPLPTNHRSRQRSEGGYRGGEQSSDIQHRPRSPLRQSTKSAATRSSGSSSSTRPSRTQYQEPSNYASSRTHPRSPTKTLDNVSEEDELYADPGRSPSPPPVPPKKRSRSPMKKMFGENGWLGQSPNEKIEIKSPKKKLFPLGNGDLQGRKKTTMMGKLKNKLEEIAEKADLAPIFKSDYEKYSKLAMLSISLTPPEQAKVYMELELMLVLTANKFLMSQFSQGRIDVDSIKKTVDLWKSKGRPLVIEFMYDQGTQRELVVANQHNFRFHGPTAGSQVRISSMLYNWKQVASLMSIRTFCSADSVLMKLLFDIEQVLELLGAGEPLMLRLQQIRSTANQNIRTARHNKEVKETIQNHPPTRQLDFNARNPDGSARYDPAKEEGYGGMKLVPESYIE